MKGMLIPTDGTPHAIDIQQDENGSALHDLQQLVGGYIEPFDVIFGENICLYVNEEGLGNCPPNRAVYATRNMEEEGYLSQMDYTSVVQEGELVKHLQPHGGIDGPTAIAAKHLAGQQRQQRAHPLAPQRQFVTHRRIQPVGRRGILYLRQGTLYRVEIFLQTFHKFSFPIFDVLHRMEVKFNHFCRVEQAGAR